MTTGHIAAFRSDGGQGSDRGLPPPPPARGSRSNAIAPDGVVGMLLFVGTEIMFFSGLISAFTIAKAGQPIWPMPGMPTFPIAFTAFNTSLLFASGIILYYSNNAYKKHDTERCAKLLLYSLLCGTSFVILQGYEWVRLLMNGFSITSGQFGSFFYLIIGVHALHAIVALAIFYSFYRRMSKTTVSKNAFWSMQVFWYFVVGIWPFLYATVYF